MSDSDLPVRILLVEDNPVDAIVVEQSLRTHAKFRYHMDHAKRLDQAIEFLGEVNYDVVILDLALPDSIGDETRQRILEHAGDAAIIILTVYERDASVLNSLREGVQEYVVKAELERGGDGRLIRIIQMAVERKNYEARFRQNAALLQGTIDSIPAAMSIIDDRGRVTRHNRAWSEFSEALQADDPEDPVAVLSRLAARLSNPGDMDLLHESIDEFVRGEREEPVQKVFELGDPDADSWRVCRVSVSPYKAAGRARCVLIHEDITQESKAARIHAEAEQLRQREKARRQFINSISHELNTPFTPIAMNLKRLKAADEKLSEKELAALQSLERNLNRLRRWVEATTDAYRRQTGVDEVKAKPVQIRRMLGQVIENVLPAFQAAGTAIQLVGPEQDRTVQCDRRRMSEVLELYLGQLVHHHGPVSVRWDHADGIKVWLPMHTESGEEGSITLALELMRDLVAAHDGNLEIKGENVVIRLPAGAEEPVSDRVPAVKESTITAK